MTTVAGSVFRRPITTNQPVPVVSHLPHIGNTQSEPAYTADHALQDSASDMPRSATPLSSRISRPRINTHRARPYHDISSRANASQKSPAPCRYFQAGTCLASNTCRYQHVLISPTYATEELDRQLLAFVSDDIPTSNDEAIQISPEEPSPFSALTPSASVDEAGVFEREVSDDEELYEVVSHPETRVAELRFHSTLHPDQPRTYFVAQRQVVVGYEGNNVGVLSGGVLLGVPGTVRVGAALKLTEYDVPGDMDGLEVMTGSSPSSISNNSEAELWTGPVTFDNPAVADRLDWADDEFVEAFMEGAESTFCSGTPPSVLPTPPPVIRRIIRSAEGHNRRHSLS